MSDAPPLAVAAPLSCVADPQLHLQHHLNLHKMGKKKGESKLKQRLAAGAKVFGYGSTVSSAVRRPPS